MLAPENWPLEGFLRGLEGHLRDLDLAHEPLPQVLQHDAVRAGKEGQNVADKVLLVWRKLFPMGIVATKVHLLGCKTFD